MFKTACCFSLVLSYILRHLSDLWRVCSWIISWAPPLRTVQLCLWLGGYNLYYGLGCFPVCLFLELICFFHLVCSNTRLIIQTLEFCSVSPWDTQKICPSPSLWLEDWDPVVYNDVDYWLWGFHMSVCVYSSLEAEYPFSVYLHCDNFRLHVHLHLSDKKIFHCWMKVLGKLLSLCTVWRNSPKVSIKLLYVLYCFWTSASRGDGHVYTRWTYLRELLMSTSGL